MRADLLIKYIWARYYEEEVEKSYRVYVTETLRYIARGEHEYISAKWLDVIDPKPPVDANEIVQDVIESAGLIQK